MTAEAKTNKELTPQEFLEQQIVAFDTLVLKNPRVFKANRRVFILEPYFPSQGPASIRGFNLHILYGNEVDANYFLKNKGYQTEREVDLISVPPISLYPDRIVVIHTNRATNLNLHLPSDIPVTSSDRRYAVDNPRSAALLLERLRQEIEKAEEITVDVVEA